MIAGDRQCIDVWAGDKFDWIRSTKLKVGNVEFDFVDFGLCRSSVQTGDKVEFDRLLRSTLSPKLNMFNSVDSVENG